MSHGRRKAEKPASIFSLLGTGISYLALCLAAMAALALVIVPMATGSQTYSVLTSSMAPKYAPGTFLVVKPVPFEELRVGDIITYQIESGAAAVITHRITSVGADQTGARTFITKGDNNSLVDPLPVQEVQIRGKLSYAVPLVGFVANSLGNSDRGAMVQWGAVGLLGYGVVTLVRGALAKKRRDDSQAAEEENESPFGEQQESGNGDDFTILSAGFEPIGFNDPVLSDCEHCGHAEDHASSHRSKKLAAA